MVAEAAAAAEGGAPGVAAVSSFWALPEEVAILVWLPVALEAGAGCHGAITAGHSSSSPPAPAWIERQTPGWDRSADDNDRALVAWCVWFLYF